MATIEKAVRLVNPGRVKRVNPARPKRRLTLLQKLHFGSKRQRAHAQALVSRKNPGKASRASGMNRKVRRAKSPAQAKYHKQRHIARINRKYSNIPNVGEIITIHPLINSGSISKRKRKVNKNPMAKTRRRRSISHVAAVKRARKAARTRAKHRTRTNPAPVRRYRRRHTRRNPMAVVHRRRHVTRHTRRNPGMGGGMFKSTIGQAIGVIGGAFVTNMGYNAVSSMASSFVTPGIMSYLAIGVIATLQGKVIGKLLKNEALGRDMTVGGFVYLALKVASDMFPSVNLGIRGMGIIGPSSFWTPQVPVPGSMGQFINPAGLLAAIPPPAQAVSSGPGMGNVSSIQRRGGRFR